MAYWVLQANKQIKVGREKFSFCTVPSLHVSDFPFFWWWKIISIFSKPFFVEMTLSLRASKITHVAYKWWLKGWQTLTRFLVSDVKRRTSWKFHCCIAPSPKKYNFATIAVLNRLQQVFQELQQLQSYNATCNWVRNLVWCNIAF